MRVVYTGAPLPADRESLFTLSIAAIPSGKPEANRVQMAFRSALKLLYRPDGLAGNPQQAYRHLIWSLTPMARRYAILHPITLRSFITC